MCCDVVRVHCRYIADNGYLYARPGFCHFVGLLQLNLRGSDSVKTGKESIYEAFILAAYGFWQVISRVTKLFIVQR